MRLGEHSIGILTALSGATEQERIKIRFVDGLGDYLGSWQNNAPPKSGAFFADNWSEGDDLDYGRKAEFQDSHQNS